MNYSFFKKPSVTAIVLIAIFSFTGFAYAKKGKQVLNAEKTDTAETQINADVAEEVKEKQTDSVVAVLPETTPPMESPQAQDVPSEKPQTNVEEKSDVKPKLADNTDSKKVDDKVVAKTSASTSTYPMHANITATVFWAGEEAGDDNGDISNLPSAWDEEWVKHFGGVDKPKKRSGTLPSGFTPKENPFYFALPYNDFDENGKRKKEINSLVPWAGRVAWKDNESVLKNQWIKIIKDDKVVYAQWEDVGPFKEDDAAYVFGTAEPKSKTNKHAGLDVSPAVHDMLGLSDIDTIDWQFVDPDQVPDGPWKTTITSSQINWK